MSRLTTIALFLSLATLVLRFAPAKAAALPISIPLAMQSAIPHSSDDSQNQAPDAPVNDVDDVSDGNDTHSHRLMVHFSPTHEAFDVSLMMAIAPDHSVKPLLPPPNSAALL